MDDTAWTRKAAAIRLSVVESVARAGKGHIGGALSCVDILVALYHGGVLRVDPARLDWPDRDRFILSKGHSTIAHFAVLADQGFLDAEELKTVCMDDSRLGEHPDHRIPGVEVDSGSLGHGLGIGAGIALGSRLSGQTYQTVVLLGDGECYEGSVWEAFMFAGHHELNNLTAIIDRNQQITLDYTEACVKLEPLADKIRAFGWDVAVVDGHDCAELISVLSDHRDGAAGKPMAVIAETVKGKGVSFMEGQLKWHHGVPTDGEIQTARQELLAVMKEVQA